MGLSRVCGISREWKFPKVLLGLLGVEFLGTVAALALFGIADPNTYRTALWQVGSDANYCSDPNTILYAYANYRPIPSVPLVWSSFPTSFNVVISVFSMFVLLVKAVMFIMHVWYPILSTVVNTIICALWAVSIYAQAGPDYSDPKYPMPVAWYIAKSCDVARPSGNYSNCLQAKGAFAVTCIMLGVFFLNLLLGIYSMIPSKTEKERRREENEDLAAHMPIGLGGKGMDSRTSTAQGEKDFEMSTVPQSARQQPFTPRTLAFNTLDRKIPHSTSNSLPFRERYQ